jgi:hypothetical protein
LRGWQDPHARFGRGKISALMSIFDASARRFECRSPRDGFNEEAGRCV